MNFERQKNLVERLLDRTRAGELSWQEGIRTEAFQVSFPNNSVQIISENQGRFNGFKIEIIDASGRVNDSFDNLQLDREQPRQSGQWSSIMGELFMLARRNALKADEAIDGILAEIG